jgi:hypothetical protein
VPARTPPQRPVRVSIDAIEAHAQMHDYSLARRSLVVLHF